MNYKLHLRIFSLIIEFRIFLCLKTNPSYNEQEIKKKLQTLPGWKYRRGMITKTYQAASFNRGIGFVVQMAMLADAADHHPDINIRYNAVEVRLATHSANGITAKDFALAAKFETAFGE